MQPTDELISTASKVIAGLVVAHERGDADAIAGLLGRLLVATAKYANPEKQRDQALNKALERL